MDYQTYQPHANLESLIKCYWTLEGDALPDTPRQRIIPDGCIEMIFILGEDIKRYTSDDEFIIQPRAMVLGQITKPFYVQPTGYVHSFAVRFYPYGFANFVNIILKKLADTETPITSLFDIDRATALDNSIREATDTKQRITIAEDFLMRQLSSEVTINSIVKSTVETIMLTRGNASIATMLKDDLSKRRQLERNFVKQIGISPKQLGRVVRLQTALKMILSQRTQPLTEIAYESDYYDQAHFTKDFMEFTGSNPSEFLKDEELTLSSLFYAKD